MTLPFHPLDADLFAPALLLLFLPPLTLGAALTALLIRVFPVHRLQQALSVDLVVWPETAAEVQAIVAIAREHRVPLVPFGAGTSLEGQVMRPMDSLVQVRSDDAKPVGLGVVVGFGR